MSAKKGDHLGAVHDIESLRLRCFCPADDECWHLRTSRGRPMPRDKVHKIFVFGKGGMTVGRAVWHLLGRVVTRQYTIYRTCESYDCANPDHFRSGRRGTYLRMVLARGPLSLARVDPLRRSRERRTKLHAEMRRWVDESTQRAPDVAHAMECSSGRVNAIRREMRTRRGAAASVFHMADMVASDAMRRAA